MHISLILVTLQSYSVSVIMANIDKKEENKQLKKQLKEALRKIEKLQSENKSLKTSNKVLIAESKKNSGN